MSILFVELGKTRVIRISVVAAQRSYCRNESVAFFDRRVESLQIGNGVYPPARRKLNSVGIFCDGHHAKQVRKSDYDYYDYLIVMEQYNIRNLMRIIGSDPEKKVYKLLDFTGSGGDIDDPWYTGDFDTAYREIVEGLEGFFEEVMA